MSAYGDTNINGYQGQIRASDQEDHCFKAGDEIMDLIEQACNNQYSGSIQRLGIESPKDTFILINDKSIKIGKTGIYEVNNAYIYSLKFAQDSVKEAVVDYII